MSKTPNIEAKIKTLRELVAWFESEDFVLEKASEKFTEASNLAQEIEKELAELKNDINIVKKSFEQAE